MIAKRFPSTQVRRWSALADRVVAACCREEVPLAVVGQELIDFPPVLPVPAVEDQEDLVGRQGPDSLSVVSRP
jgi:hypothetical protein